MSTSAIGSATVTTSLSSAHAAELARRDQIIRNQAQTINRLQDVIQRRAQDEKYESKQLDALEEEVRSLNTLGQQRDAHRTAYQELQQRSANLANISQQKEKAHRAKMLWVGIAIGLAGLIIGIVAGRALRK